MNKSYSMKEMAVREFELPFSAIFSFKQLDSLVEVRNTVNQLWRDHKPLWEFIQKLKMYSIETDQYELFEKWERENQTAFLGYKTLNLLRDALKARICEVCHSPFSAVRSDQKYCKDSCKQRAFQRRKRKAMTYD